MSTAAHSPDILDIAGTLIEARLPRSDRPLPG